MRECHQLVLISDPECGDYDSVKKKMAAGWGYLSMAHPAVWDFTMHNGGMKFVCDPGGDEHCSKEGCGDHDQQM